MCVNYKKMPKMGVYKNKCISKSGGIKAGIKRPLCCKTVQNGKVCCFTRSLKKEITNPFPNKPQSRKAWNASKFSQ